MTGTFPSAVLDRARDVALAIFDVDGVLTDGRLILGPDGGEYKAFHTRDGQGLVMLREIVALGIITGRRSPVVAARMHELGINMVFQGQSDKDKAFKTMLKELGIEPQQVCYVGDDLPDLAVMTQVGLPIAVADAHPMVREQAVWTTDLGGGRGAVREVCDLIIEASGNGERLYQRYSGRRASP